MQVSRPAYTKVLSEILDFLSSRDLARAKSVLCLTRTKKNRMKEDQNERRKGVNRGLFIDPNHVNVNVFTMGTLGPSF